jgi:hypothetical protein
MRHIDVGSRIDGFVAHLACARPVDVYDIRPLDVVIPNVRFRQWDLTASDSTASEEPADCVSCLHTLEHVGLGRYGDKLDSDGWRVGLARLASLVRPGGQLWLSVPVGQRRVEFNAHRVFDACEVRDAAIALGLLLEEFRVLNEGGTWCSATSEADWDRIAYERYRLGIYLFRRPQAALTDAGLR